MKLNLSTNLRRLRTAKGLTQENLAVLLGVTHKAVSRWETGAAYPDIELLPTLAEHFGVCIEELLGTTNAERERASEEYYARLRRIPKEETDAAIGLLREMHREFPRDTNVILLLCDSISDQVIEEGKTELLDQLRRYTGEIIALNGRDDSDAQWAIQMLIDAEDEEHVQPLLETYTATFGRSRELVLEYRYLVRHEWERHALEHQKNLLHAVRMAYYRLGKNDPRNEDAHDCLWTVQKELALIDLLTDHADPTVPDLWFEPRFHAMIGFSCYLAATGEKERALSTLEAAVDLYEAFWALPDGTRLTYRCYRLDQLGGTVEHTVYIRYDAGQDGQERTFESRRVVHDLGYGESIDPERDHEPLIARQGWAWFDAIRGEKRYQDCVGRMKKLIIDAPDAGQR